jgi:hypothetical protein
VTRDRLDEVREACARVAAGARRGRNDPEALEKLGSQLAGAEALAGLDPARRFRGDADTTLAFVLTLDALNFGSGWFPLLRKRPGRSGYLTIAGALEERFARAGPWSAAALQCLGADECARVFGQTGGHPDLRELMELFAASLRDLGHFLATRFAGRFAGPVEAAGGSAARLVALLAEMPLYRDVARLEGAEVPFYKRAQISASDLARAFGERGFGRFDDLAKLTCFADNLVPHVLRCEGVLVYAPELARRIDAEELLAAGSREEVEIRAAAVHAVEGCVAVARRAGAALRACDVDALLWNRGQAPEIKARPRHRTRTPYY